MPPKTDEARPMQDILILGAGPAGLTLALSLHQAGIPCRVYEQAPEIKAVGVGVNLLPHAVMELAKLGLLEALQARAVTTDEAQFFNRYGQLIHSEKLGQGAGYPAPQLSIHRADLQDVLLAAARERLGPDSVQLGHRVIAVETQGTEAVVHFADGKPDARGSAAIAADGVHSTVRKQFHPHETGFHYTGYNMWRGVTAWKPFLTGATMTRAGWLADGKMVIYPIRNNIDAEGRQLINWVAEVEWPNPIDRDWNRRGKLEDFLPFFADWHFPWLDVPAMMQAAEVVLEFPMVDQDPLPWWTQGLVTLMGDAAHPMVPRGSNGAGQSILDAVALTKAFVKGGPVAGVLASYEAERRPATSAVVLQNRKAPPDALLGEVYKRTGNKPFGRIEDVISREELLAITNGYKQVAGYTLEDVARRAAG
jgi:2-polyprenyl-6-methoxyphenol hydroxylase-like FAD-dependent oxidoreductase